MSAHAILSRVAELPDNRDEASPESIRLHLQAIATSRAFATATRARRFLIYVVEETIAGRADGVKQLVTALEQRRGDVAPVSLDRIAEGPAAVDLEQSAP